MHTGRSERHYTVPLTQNIALRRVGMQHLVLLADISEKPARNINQNSTSPPHEYCCFPLQVYPFTR